MERLNSEYCEALKNEIRDVNCDSKIIKENLITLGKNIGEKIYEKYFLDNKSITTPLGISINGRYPLYKQIIIVSTSDDYELFGNGIAQVFRNSKQGKIDFGGVHGFDALKSPFRSITLPDAQNVDTVIIAKSVLATGCTAISLIRKVMEKYWPDNIIVASIFYSEAGYAELMNQSKTKDVFVIGNPDELLDNGLLSPGMGNLDERIKN